MAHDTNIHQLQVSILRELLFKPSEKYAELCRKTGIESDKFKFHLKKLVDLGYIEKLEYGKYALSVRGKEHANKLDTDNNTIERQPKTSVLLLIESRGEDGRPTYLFQQRLKHPYFGYWGIPGGKIRWGETIHQAAVRELYEETGLSAKIDFVGVYHEHTSDTDGSLLEDKIFFVVRCHDVKGSLINKFEGGINRFMTHEETKTLDKKYDSFDFELEYALGKLKPDALVEKQQTYSSDEF